MLELQATSKAPELAREWLENNPNHAIVGSIPIAAGRSFSRGWGLGKGDGP